MFNFGKTPTAEPSENSSREDTFESQNRYRIKKETLNDGRVVYTPCKALSNGLWPPLTKTGGMYYPHLMDISQVTLEEAIQAIEKDIEVHRSIWNAKTAKTEFIEWNY